MAYDEYNARACHTLPLRLSVFVFVTHVLVLVHVVVVVVTLVVLLYLLLCAVAQQGSKGIRDVFEYALPTYV